MVSLTQWPGLRGISSVVAGDKAVAEFKRELVSVTGAGFQVQDVE